MGLHWAVQPHRPACRSEAAPDLAVRARAQVEVDLGKFEGAEEAARAHDRAAVWCLGLTAPTNFPIADSLRVRAPALGGRRRHPPRFAPVCVLHSAAHLPWRA